MTQQPQTKPPDGSIDAGLMLLVAVVPVWDAGPQAEMWERAYKRAGSSELEVVGR